MAELLFGTGGVPPSAKQPSTVSGIERISELGLGCMELEFVQGVRMSEIAAYQVAETAAKTGIKLSAHAPYFINLNARELEKIKSSQERLLKTARIAALCGASSVVLYILLSDQVSRRHCIRSLRSSNVNQLRTPYNKPVHSNCILTEYRKRSKNSLSLCLILWFELIKNYVSFVWNFVCRCS